MKNRQLKLLIIVLCAFFATPVSTAQVPTARIEKLQTPRYPPLAKTARITGEVRLKLIVDPGGAVSSVQLISGPPMLVEAAEDSAKGSNFACENCLASVTQEISYN